MMSENCLHGERQQHCTTAVQYAERAVALAPNDPETQLAVAISYGKLLPFLSTKEQIADSRLIKAAADKVIELDAKNDLAWQVLGRWYLGLADVGAVKRALAQMTYGKLPDATYEDAVRCFEKAIALNPNRLMHYIELGAHLCADGQGGRGPQIHHQGVGDAEHGKGRSRVENCGPSASREAALRISGSASGYTLSVKLGSMYR